MTLARRRQRNDVAAPIRLGRDPKRDRLFAKVQQRMPAVWDAWRLNFQDESVVVVPSVTLDRTVPGSGSLAQAFEETVLVPAAAAASAAVAHDLRHLDADQAEHRGVLPRAAAGRDPQPCHGQVDSGVD